MLYLSRRPTGQPTLCLSSRRERLASTLHGPTFDSTLEGTAVPAIDAVVSHSVDGHQIFIKVVNTDPSQPIPTEILLTGVHVANKRALKL